jgi:SAM-dependent methyltransferase
MREKLEKIRDLVNDLIASLDERAPIKEEPKLENYSEFGLLKGLLESTSWPEAVFSAQIADDSSESDKMERAEGISDIILPPVLGKKFLDFGCGEGHVAKHVSKEAALSVGYDIISRDPSWENKSEKLLLTTDFEKVKAEGPYDTILIYDVLDHSQESPEELLIRAKSVLSQEGKIYLRCHPWTGRHGGHAYKKINKAFIHLVFEEKELSELGVVLDHNRKILRPINTYNKAIEDAGLKRSEPEVDTQEVEAFFEENPLVRNRILKSLGLTTWTSDAPAFQMSQCFLDYVLTAN